MLFWIPQGFIKIIVMNTKNPAGSFSEFRRNSAGILTEFRQSFHGIPRNIIPLEKFRGIPRNFLDGIFTEFRTSVWEIPSKYNSAGIIFDGMMDTLYGRLVKNQIRNAHNCLMPEFPLAVFILISILWNSSNSAQFSKIGIYQANQSCIQAFSRRLRYIVQRKFLTIRWPEVSLHCFMELAEFVEYIT